MMGQTLERYTRARTHGVCLCVCVCRWQLEGLHMIWHLVEKTANMNVYVCVCVCVCRWQLEGLHMIWHLVEKAADMKLEGFVHQVQGLGFKQMKLGLFCHKKRGLWGLNK